MNRLLIAIGALACALMFTPINAEALTVRDAADLSIVSETQAPSAFLTDDGRELAQLTQLRDTEVEIVSPQTIEEMRDSIPHMIALAIVAILARFMGPFAFALKLARADDSIEKFAKGVIDEWLDDHPDWREKGITVDAKKEWIARIARLFVEAVPKWLVQFLGGEEALRQKVRNRLPDILKDAFPAIHTAMRG